RDWLPTDDKADLRDWEWYFLKERARGRFALAGHEERATAVAYRADGKQIASAGGPASKPGDVKLWDPLTGALQFELRGHRNSITSVAYSADGKLLASAS